MEINSFISPEILATLQTGGYFLMFSLMVAEWPFVTLASAFLASIGLFNIFVVALLGWFGDIAGDMLFFYIGRYGLKIFSKQTTIDTLEEKKFIYKLDGLIEKNLLIAIFLIKFIPYAPPIWLPYIGRSKISSKKFFFYTLIACLPVPLIATIIGFHISFFTKLFQNASLEQIILVSMGILIVLIFLVFSFFHFQKHISQKFENISPKK